MHMPQNPPNTSGVISALADSRGRFGVASRYRARPVKPTPTVPSNRLVISDVLDAAIAQMGSDRGGICPLAMAMPSRNCCQKAMIRPQ